MENFNYSQFVLPKGNNSEILKALLKGHLLKNCRKIILKSDLSIDTRIFFSILISSGVRLNEAIRYKSDTIKDIIKVTLPILKKKDKTFQTIEIKPSLWQLREEDYKKWEGIMKSDRTYNRACKSTLGITPRDYRSLFTIWSLRETKDIHFVRDLLNHSNISVTDNYLKKQQINHQKLWDLTSQKKG